VGSWSQEGSRDQLAANVSLVDGLLAPRRALRGFVGRQLLPSATRIAEFYELRSPRSAQIAYFRLAHLAKMVGRYLLALWRVRLGRRRWVGTPEL
jgi:hypothetical protein